MIPADIATFNDSTSFCISILTISSAKSKYSGCTPFASLPKIIPNLLGFLIVFKSDEFCKDVTIILMS